MALALHVISQVLDTEAAVTALRADLGIAAEGGFEVRFSACVLLVPDSTVQAKEVEVTFHKPGQVSSSDP